MKDSRLARRAAVAATVGFAGLALFQLLLAAGAPFGAAAWGGTNTTKASAPRVCV